MQIINIKYMYVYVVCNMYMCITNLTPQYVTMQFIPLPFFLCFIFIGLLSVPYKIQKSVACFNTFCFHEQETGSNHELLNLNCILHPYFCQSAYIVDERERDKKYSNVHVFENSLAEK